jgi:hypothetical protein
LEAKNEVVDFDCGGVHGLKRCGFDIINTAPLFVDYADISRLVEDVISRSQQDWAKNHALQATGLAGTKDMHTTNS